MPKLSPRHSRALPCPLFLQGLQAAQWVGALGGIVFVWLLASVYLEFSLPHWIQHLDLVWTFLWAVSWLFVIGIPSASRARSLVALTALLPVAQSFWLRTGDLVRAELGWAGFLFGWSGFLLLCVVSLILLLRRLVGWVGGARLFRSWAWVCFALVLGLNSLYGAIILNVGPGGVVSVLLFMIATPFAALGTTRLLGDLRVEVQRRLLAERLGDSPASPGSSELV